ncbi:uncharacterized protein LOC134199242 [Bombyx mori]|uniref:uncharacterized protein LOC134199242 n=1 Tax=Bombyx mori TaxID=7091 RepID=UPI002ED0AF98
MSCESAQVAGGETSAVAAHPVCENRADRLDGTEAGRRVRQTTRPRLQHGLPRLEPPRSGCTCARARRLVGDCEVNHHTRTCTIRKAVSHSTRDCCSQYEIWDANAVCRRSMGQLFTGRAEQRAGSCVTSGNFGK